jgi:alkylation response protein AidB-like acyl-CoA dehydrogenase
LRIKNLWPWYVFICGQVLSSRWGLQEVHRMRLEFDFGEEHQRFRREIREFLRKYWVSDRASDEDILRFRRKAIDAGYLARAIPREYGGSEQEHDPIKAALIKEEFQRVGAPEDPSNIGVGLLVPTLLECGEEWQKQKFIEPTMLGQMIWCQGYSEPGAGSDLASLRTRGDLVGDEWVINGQKIWTSMTTPADYMFALVRTEPDQPRHKGISYLLIDMRQPGIDVRPLKMMTGLKGFNEVFFEDARTPRDWIVGARGDGWKVSRATLKHERSGLFLLNDATNMLDGLLELARTRSRNGKPAIEDLEVRQRLASLEASMMANGFSLSFRASKGLKGQNPGRIQLMEKLIRTDIYEDVVKLAIELVGDDALLLGDASEEVSLGFASPKHPSESAEWVSGFMGSLGGVSAGGSSNIQRNLIAEHGLGLPRDLAAQKNR